MHQTYIYTYLHLYLRQDLFSYFHRIFFFLGVTVRFLCLRVTQKALQLSVLCFFSSSVFQKRTNKSFFANISSLLPRKRVARIGLINTTCHVFALEINSNGGFEREHVESCPSTFKKNVHYHNSNGYQTWRLGDLSSEAPHP